MSRSVFNDYCSVLFPLLKKIDSFYLAKGIQRNDRYLGYIANKKNANDIHKQLTDAGITENRIVIYNLI